MVREAIREFSERTDRLTESERIRMLRVLDEIAERPPTRTSDEVDAELEGIRRARRTGGRRTRVE